MATSWIVITRQDDGAKLVLDGVIGFRAPQPISTPQYPIEGGIDGVIGVQPSPRMIYLDVLVSETPALTDITKRGRDRIDEVLGFFAGSIGRALTITPSDRPVYRDMLTMTVDGDPDYSASSRLMRLSLIFRQVYSATNNKVTGGLSQSRAADPVRAGGDQVDRGAAGSVVVR